MDYSDAIQYVKTGHCVGRQNWDSKVIMARSICFYSKEQLHLSELRDSFQTFIKNTCGQFNIKEEELLSFNYMTGDAYIYIPTLEDVLAKDWEIVRK